MISTVSLVDLAMAISLIEGFALVAYFRFAGKGLAPGEFALNLLSGLCLMLALRNALTQTHWSWIALCLFCAGLAHWVDLWHRWQRKVQDENPA